MEGGKGLVGAGAATEPTYNPGPGQSERRPFQESGGFTMATE